MGFHLRHIAAFAAIGLVVSFSGCGGGGDGGSSLPTGPNVQSIAVDSFAGNVNLLYATVRVCAPGSSVNCQSIDHVLVDTGSYGLRISSTILSANVATTLGPAQRAGAPRAESAPVAAGCSCGAVTVDDVRIAEETASSIPIQIIDDGAFPNVPVSCANTGTRIHPADLGANGILGIGMFLENCGVQCESSTALHIFFTCPGGTCADTTVPRAQQIQNPVGHFAVNNNGTVVMLPSLGAGGARSATGVLIFGVGTQGNNALGGARVQGVNPSTGSFTTDIPSLGTYNDSFIDSGSNGIFFDSGLHVCPGPSGFYCPGSTLTFSGTNNYLGTSIPVTFQVADAQALLAANPNNYAQPLLAGTANLTGVFDWGLPFFYGRSIFTAIEGRSTPAGVGPFFAY